MRGPTGTVLLRCVLVAGLLLVPGCTDDAEEPGTLPTRSQSRTPTTTSASPDTPEAQIEATMQDYFAAFNRAFATGKVSELRKFSTDGCPCRDSADRIARTFNSGGRFEGAEYSVKSIRVHDVEGRTGLAEVVALVPPYKVFDGSGKVTENSAGGQLHTDYSLVKQSSGEWIIGNSLDFE